MILAAWMGGRGRGGGEGIFDLSFLYLHFFFLHMTFKEPSAT